MRTDRSANSESLISTDSVPPKLYRRSPGSTGRYQSQVLPETNTWIPRKDGRFKCSVGGSAKRGAFRPMPTMGGAIWLPHRVDVP